MLADEVGFADNSRKICLNLLLNTIKKMCIGNTSPYFKLSLLCKVSESQDKNKGCLKERRIKKKILKSVEGCVTNAFQTNLFHRTKLFIYLSVVVSKKNIIFNPKVATNEEHLVPLLTRINVDPHSIH